MPIKGYCLPLERMGKCVMSPQEIKTMLETGLETTFVEVLGDDGRHFEATVVSPAFAGKTRVQQHQLVYQALGNKMHNDIHALSLRTLTPEQWQTR